VALPRRFRRPPRQEPTSRGLLAWLNQNSGAIQAISSLIAVVVAALAVVFAFYAFVDQSTTNGMERDRFERRYASRVAWWFEGPVATANGVTAPTSAWTLVVQNRAPIPVRGAVFSLDVSESSLRYEMGVSADPAVRELFADTWPLPELRPCELVRVSIRYEKKVSVPTDLLSEAGVVMFIDGASSGLWVLTARGLDRTQWILFPQYDSAKAPLISRRDASDCGESG
jgi:hypothetical protein